MFAISCGNTETNPPVETSSTATVAPTTPPEPAVELKAPENLLACSDNMKKFVEVASKEGHIGIVASDIGKEAGISYFSMKNPNEIESVCRGYLNKAGLCVTVFNKNGIVGPGVYVYEWTLADAGQVKKLMDNLTAPLTKEQKMAGYERFFPTPFTFWQHENRLYYFSTMAEDTRADMDKLSDLLSKTLSGGSDQLY